MVLFIKEVEVDGPLSGRIELLGVVLEVHNGETGTRHKGQLMPCSYCATNGVYGCLGTVGNGPQHIIQLSAEFLFEL